MLDFVKSTEPGGAEDPLKGLMAPTKNMLGGRGTPSKLWEIKASVIIPKQPAVFTSSTKMQITLEEEEEDMPTSRSDDKIMSVRKDRHFEAVKPSSANIL
jgi:hypothetical protein